MSRSVEASTSESPEDMGREKMRDAEAALHIALENMALARTHLTGFGVEPARSLSIAITQCETTALWLEKSMAVVSA